MINILVDNTEQFIASIKDGIDEGRITDWGYTPVGCFTYLGEHKTARAYFIPRTSIAEINFTIAKHVDVSLTRHLYDIYHEKFSEMLALHFGRQIKAIKVTSKPTYLDFKIEKEKLRITADILLS